MKELGFAFRLLLLILLLAGLSYGVVAFVEMNWNPVQWHIWGRVAAVALVAVIGTALLAPDRKP